MTSLPPTDPHQLAEAIAQSEVELVRFSWCDIHGMLRGKALTAKAAIKALQTGISMVSTLMLKDTADRTTYKVFESGIEDQMPGFGHANNLTLLPIASTWRILPWTRSTGWVLCQPFFADGSPVPYDSRAQLMKALDRLNRAGFQMKCGLEVEFHIYKLLHATDDPAMDPQSSDWPPPAPTVQLMHPGYNLLSEAWFDQSEEALRIVQRTAEGLNLPLSSLEIELGPSQVEAVFEATDALTAADNMVMFRSAVRQALRRAGYHATFMCRPPFPNIMSSGWHLHQSLEHLGSQQNAFVQSNPSQLNSDATAHSVLSDIGVHYLAGLLSHAKGMAALCSPTANSYGRFRPNALAPQLISWGHDNRGAMLRVIGPAGHESTRIENRLGEPAANPYLYFSSQIHAGLSGMAQQLMPPQAILNPYAEPADPDQLIPHHLTQALNCLSQDPMFNAQFGPEFIQYFCHLKHAEAKRHQESRDPVEFDRREYFGRI